MSVVDDNTKARRAQVRLSDLDPDFLRLISSEERDQAAEVALPAVDLIPGPFAPGGVLSEAAGGGWRDMKHDANRRREIDRKPAHNLLERLYTAGGRADYDQLATGENSSAQAGSATFEKATLKLPDRHGSNAHRPSANLPRARARHKLTRCAACRPTAPLSP